MALLTEHEQRKVAEAIARVERDTDAELVTVLAARADDYAYIPLLWASLLALVVPGVVHYLTGWLTLRSLLLVQWGLFIVLCLLFRLPKVTTHLIPRRVRHWRASNLARRQFLEQNLHHTVGGTGVLIFVSEAERYVLSWRLTGERPLRDRQLSVVKHMGRELQRLTRMRSLSIALKLMRKPAQAAGLSSLQQFLESGFSAFASLGDAQAFLATINEREHAWIDTLFDAAPDSCQRALADELARA